MRSFDELVAEFVATPKTAVRKPRWRTKKTIPTLPRSRSTWRWMASDTSQAELRSRHTVSYCPEIQLFTDLSTQSSAWIGCQSGAVTPEPPRQSQRFGYPLAAVACYGSAEPDERDQTFSVWLHEFLVRANVTCNYRVPSPPRGKQLGLLNGIGPIAS